MSLIRPHRLTPGDRVAVVAASGPVNREKFAAGLEALDARYDLVYDEIGLFARTGFLAGNDAHRLHALNTAIEDPECRGIFLARGGYGLTRILPGVNQAALRDQPKLIVGYSDVTALLAVCAQVGVAAVHGPMISDFGSLSEDERNALCNLLENPDPGEILTGLRRVVGGSVQGPLIGGNLEVLSRLLGTALQPDFAGAVLFLEEIGELPYRVDRLLTHLEMAGVLNAVAGVLVGDFTDCDDLDGDEIQPPGAEDVLMEHLERLPVPVCMGGGFGHGDRKASLPYGVRVELDAETGVLTALEGAVS